MQRAGGERGKSRELWMYGLRSTIGGDLKEEEAEKKLVSEQNFFEKVHLLYSREVLNKRIQ